MADRPQKYAEGGARGWLVVLSSFLGELVVYGTLKGFGVLVDDIREDLGADTWVVSSVGSLHFGVQFVLTPAMTAIASRMKRRAILVGAGGALYGIGLILASLATDVTYLALSFVLISGAGAACVLDPPRGEMAYHFNERFALASFAALFGAPTGMMVYGPVTRVLLDTYGWRGTVLILGGLGSNLVWAGMLLPAHPPSQPPQSSPDYALLPPDDALEAPPASGAPGPVSSPREPRRSWREAAVDALGLDVLVRPDFLLVAGGRMAYSIAYGGVLVYAVLNGVSLGLSPAEASFLTTAFGLGSLLGLLVGSGLLGAKVLSAHAAAALGGVLAAGNLLLAPVLTTFLGQVANSVAMGASLHLTVGANTVLLKILPYCDQKFFFLLGWSCLLTGVASSVGDVIAGWIYGTTDSFVGTFCLLSSTMVVSVVIYSMSYLRHRRS